MRTMIRKFEWRNSAIRVQLFATSTNSYLTIRQPFYCRQLPHSIVGPLDDVVLFVRDLVKGRKQDCDKTIDHWETVLRQKGVDCIKEIIPINKVRTEYSQYEMQRKLATAFDYHLADGRICGHLTHLLGKPFFQKCNAPTPIKLDRDDLKKEITTALHKGCMEVHEYGNCHVMKIGTVSMDKKKLAQNVLAACKVLGTQYPGGWDNIRAIRLKTTKGMAIPIYINLGKFLDSSDKRCNKPDYRKNKICNIFHLIFQRKIIPSRFQS